MSKIYREEVTGARADRRQLLDMLKHLVPGDRVIVTRIDRFARSTFALFAIVEGRRGGPCAARASALVARPPRKACLLYTSPSPRDRTRSRMPSSA